MSIDLDQLRKTISAVTAANYRLASSVLLSSRRFDEMSAAARDLCKFGDKADTPGEIATYAGLRVELDPYMPDDLIMFRDGAGRILQVVRIGKENPSHET